MPDFTRSRWAAIISITELVDGQYEIHLQNPAGGPDVAREKFHEGEDPQPWLAQTIGQWVRPWVKEYHQYNRRDTAEEEMLANAPAGYAQGYVNEAGEPLMTGEQIRYEQYLDGDPDPDDYYDRIREDAR